MVQVLMDDKSVQTVVTDDRTIHVFYPDWQTLAIGSFTFFKDANGLEAFGTTEAIPAESALLLHLPIDPIAPEKVKVDNSGTWLPNFFRDYTDDEDDEGESISRDNLFRPLQHVKFPRFKLDEDSGELVMHYWTNILLTDINAFLEGEDDAPDVYTLLESAAEPFQQTGSVDFTLTRVMAHTVGQFQSAYDNASGSILPRNVVFWERPQVLTIPNKFDSTNLTEPVLDIHSGGITSFLEFRTFT